MYLAAPQGGFAEDCFVLPTAASTLSIYPSGTGLAIAYMQFKAEATPLI